MQPSDFTQNKPGNLRRQAEGYWTFTPNPLPPPLKWDSPLAQVLSEAERAIGLLEGVGKNLPNPDLLIRPFVRKEAVLSSRIEGTLTSFSDLLFFEARPTDEPRVPDVQEVQNYVKAMEYGLKRIESLPLSLRLIRELHAVLMQGVRGEHLTPGEFRRSQNWIGPPGRSLNEATYTPPSPGEFLAAMGDLETYLHAECEYPPIVRIALIHYQFEAIHPFLDGNGRLGRLLTTLLLSHWNLLTQPLLYLSAYFEKTRDEYYVRLLEVSRNGKWTPWVRYFLQGVALQAQDGLTRANRLLRLRNEYLERVRTPRASGLLSRLVEALFERPAITANQAKEILGVKYSSAQNSINRLDDLGILVEITNQRRNRVYFATEIIEIVEGS